MDRKPITLDLTVRELQSFRLRKIGKSQVWLAEKLGKTTPEISLYFRQNAFPDLEPLVEKAIAKEEAREKI